MSAELDVVLLARVLHSQPHHYRGGADDDLARIACTQMTGPSKCERKAASIAREYARLSFSVVTVNDDGTADVAEES